MYWLRDWLKHFLARCAWLGNRLPAYLRCRLPRSAKRPSERRPPAPQHHHTRSALDFAREAVQAEERFHVAQAAERELGGLVPPATGPRPQPTSDQKQGRQRAPHDLLKPSRESRGREL